MTDKSRLMKTIAVLQNTDAEHLGLVEDHLEGRNIRFRYIRPAHDERWEEKFDLPKDGLIVLGAAPYGTVSTPVVPLLEKKVTVINNCLQEQLPTLAFGTGTQLLMLAAGGAVRPSELSFSIDTAKRIHENALNGYIPEQYPMITYMRDFPVLPDHAEIHAALPDGTPALFQLPGNCLGFIGHPGMKSAMLEDSMVQTPAFHTAGPGDLVEVRRIQPQVEQSLVMMMTGVIQLTGWMN